MASQTVIPVFPCRSLKATLTFYNAMGFETLHEQHAPYVYGSVRYQDIQIDFHGSAMTADTTQETGHMCLVLTTGIEVLHGVFANGLKQQFGKRPRSGIPRLGSVNTVSKDHRFNLIDPDGNCIIVIEVGTANRPKPKRHTPLSRAISMARLDAYSRDEPIIAAEYLDHALQHLADEPGVTQFRAFVLRADIATTLRDDATRQAYMEAAQSITLAEDDMNEAGEEIERLQELIAMGGDHTP
jgi:catechol 2,3-dioxygenase-like lactoylglutathione lyase family enzyme